ncbi:tetratricopeptide repeat protein [Leadbettera azotonutricia]|uniref:Tetratricopeptide repeat protein n=1 Tax=Leadbettera azotonutricia (strain ATCC BAA-888 / DSM 13862 / ZAS-9) TaxID=545695 RepID=F5YC67_LEAAZ|nr:tetratricopeptide repeat protein [Leadbettera azotonutricia]AEF80441.1 tetratricopeptide repeat protein [Leadbettera azotonutricia ZAS-9]
MAHEKNAKHGDLSFTEKLSEFLQKNRKGLIVCLAASIVILAGILAGFTIKDKLESGALSKVEEFSRRYEALRVFIGSEEADAASKQADIAALQEELNAFTAKNRGYPAARAWAIAGNIYGDLKNWADSEKAWSSAAKAAAKTYYAPISLFNAAAAAEEQGNNAGAIDLYTRALDFASVFPSAPRAQFSIGRLQEAQGNKAAALEAYRTLLSKWPNDQVWSNLAHSRIVTLSIP